jgi:DNA repair exonuclease SbcCD ATPase subunit
MRILQFVAENFKRIRIVEIVPTKRVTKITGKNGQGKTSVLDALWALFAGKRGIPDKPVRRGADRSRIRAVIGDENGKPLLIATRTIATDRTTNLTVEAAPGAEPTVGTPQAVLDALIGQMSFDPIAFIHADQKSQVEILRTLVKIDLDIDAENELIKKEYDERTELRKEAKSLALQALSATYSPNLPFEKIDEKKIMAEIDTASQRNKELDKIAAAKRDLGNAAERAARVVQENEATIARASDKIADLEGQLEQARQVMQAAQSIQVQLMTEEAAAELAFEAAPAADLTDLTPLLEDLRAAQLVNREIDRRSRWEELDEARKRAEREAEARTRSIADREERKRTALAGAEMPIEGLTFDEQGVFFHAIPLQQLGEAEQIRVGVGLAMASNPKLRAVPIAHGESLDDESLALIERMAEENDFQIFMARVDSSGKVGIVLADGRVESVNE